MKLEDVSVVVTSRNDVATIGDCLESAREFGVVVVVDAFSTDGTVDKARKAGAVVYQRSLRDPAEQKNWALSRVTSRWILTVDACEMLSDGLRERIAGTDGSGVDGFAVRVQNEYLGKAMTSRAAGFGGSVRLFTRGSDRFVLDDRDATGASVESKGKTTALEGDLLRREFRDIHLHFAQINRVTTVAAREYVDGGGRVSPIRMVVQPTLRFWQLYLAQGGIWDGSRGLMYCMLRAYESFIKLAKVWELNAGRNRKKEGRREETA